MGYKANANGITHKDLIIGDQKHKAVYAGGRLIWEKGGKGTKIYEVFAEFKSPLPTLDDGRQLCEEGIRFPSSKYNPLSTVTVERCAAMGRKYTSSSGIGTSTYAECTIAFTGQASIAWGELHLYCEHYSKYVDADGNYTEIIHGILNMEIDADGVYSPEGNYFTFPIAFNFSNHDADDILWFKTRPDPPLFESMNDLKSYMKA